jgi:hypothetical protein
VLDFFSFNDISNFNLWGLLNLCSVLGIVVSQTLRIPASSFPRPKFASLTILYISLSQPSPNPWWSTPFSSPIAFHYSALHDNRRSSIPRSGPYDIGDFNLIVYFISLTSTSSPFTSFLALSLIVLLTRLLSKSSSSYLLSLCILYRA